MAQHERRTAYEIFKQADAWKKIAMVTSIFVFLTMAVGAANMLRVIGNEWFLAKFGQPPYMPAAYRSLVVDNSLDRLYRRRDELLYLIATKKGQEEKLGKVGQRLLFADQELLRHWQADLLRVQKQIERLESQSDSQQRR